MKKTVDPKTGAVIFEEEASLLDEKQRPMNRQEKRAFAREQAKGVDGIMREQGLNRRERRALQRRLAKEAIKVAKEL